ncbi:MAG: complex I NDUFA9 subunit family protein [Proteobacteria bacterium]|nr:complex I NDUFA9 subunit family protein [Pseudomonadota bacterium]
MASLVTIFGGSGFIGRNAVRALAKAGYRIRVAVRYPNLAHYLPPMGTVGQIQLMKCNVNDADQVARAMQGADAVVNLVGVLYSRGKQTFDALQAHAPGTIAMAAKAAGAKTFVQVSAIGADEDSESDYARTKAEGERAVREEFPAAAILRPSIVFGPEDAFFNKFASLARLLPFLPLIGGGQTKFQPVFVGDVADAIVTCVSDPATQGNTYELGGPGIYSFRDLMQFILRETGRSRPLLPVPFFLASLKAMFLQFLPTPPLTPDQVTLLKTDNVVSSGARTFKDLGIQPDSIEAIVPAYLYRFRPKGQFDEAVRERVTGSP